MCFYAMFKNLFDHLLRFPWLIDMFDTILISTLFLLAPLVSLLTLPILTDIWRFQPPPPPNPRLF